jgi:hypothetical protein
MLHAAAEDRDNHVEVLGEKDLQHWMERSMNIIDWMFASWRYIADIEPARNSP